MSDHSTSAHTSPQSLPDRFWAKVNKTESCWLWTGASNGYGRFNIGNRTVEYAHRVAWILTHGPISDGFEVCHNCPGGDNPLCVNPAHLFLGTQADNNADCRAKGRHSNGERPRGSGHGMAKLTEHQVIEIRRLHACGTPQRALARRFHISRRSIAFIVKRIHWRHV